MRLLCLLLSLVVFVSYAFASNGAKLRIKIAGVSANNAYFLCVGHAGCLSIKAGNQGHVFTIERGELNRVYASNIRNLRLYPQPLPKSCKINVKENQTVTITGKITRTAKNEVYIGNLQCSVVA